MKKKLTIQKLIEFIEKWEQEHIFENKEDKFFQGAFSICGDIKSKATELLSVEKEEIEIAFNSGHINGWVDGTNDAEQTINGKQYFTENFEL